jgi:hypothetical protein
VTNRTPAPPRNYFGIPPVDRVNRATAPVYHETLQARGLLTGALEVEIEALSPVHVGCGAFELLGDRIVKEPIRRGGALVIPGASIKGMCRQTFEALTASGSPFDRDESHRAGRPGQPTPGVSAAASLFGTLGLQGRVSFDDAVPVGPAAPAELRPEAIALSVAYAPRTAVGRRFYGLLPQGADQPPTIPALAIPAGSLLLSHLRFRNLARQEMGGLLTSLGVGLFTPRLGGGKYDDFGWVRFRPRAVRLRGSGLEASEWERSPGAVEAFVKECRDQVRLAGSGRDALDTLIRKLQFPRAALSGEAPG